MEKLNPAVECEKQKIITAVDERPWIIVFRTEAKLRINIRK
jgi:hypothetical protein